MVDQPAELPDLKGNAVRGSLWNFAGGSIQGIAQIVSVAFLARMLTPAEYGIATAAFVAIGLLEVVSRLGVTPAIVQKPTLTQTDIASAAWAILGASVLLAALVSLVSPWVNTLLALHPDEKAIPLLALQLPLYSLGAISLGLLQRNVAFKRIIVIDTVSFLTGTVGTSLTLAFLGFGPYSIILGNLATTAIATLGYRVSWRHSWSLANVHEIPASLARLLRFGMTYSVGELGAWLAVNAGKFIIANRLGAASLGIFGRAFQLLISASDLVGGVVERVLFPTFSRIQHDLTRVRSGQVQATSMVTLLTILGATLVWWNADDIVHILFGPGWERMIFPLQVLGLGLVPRASCELSFSLTRAMGRVSVPAMLQWVYSALVVAGALIGSTWGINGVAVGTTTAIFIHHTAMLIYTNRCVPGLLPHMLRMYLRFIPLTLAANVAGAVTAASVIPLPIVLRVVTISAAAMISAGAVVLVLRRAFELEIRTFGSIVSSVSQKRADPRSH